jgi:hypothetical protein
LIVLLFMRGSDQNQDDAFSYVSLEERVPADHPLPKIRALVDQVLKEMSPQFGKLYSEAGRPFDPAGAAAASIAIAGLLFGAERAVADGAIGLQPVVPLVRGNDDGRADLGADGVHQGPGTTAETVGGGKLFPAGAETGPAVSVR